MRLFLNITFLLFFSLNCFAQKNEIGTHLVSYSVSTFGDKYDRTGVANQGKKPFIFLNGITYKRYINEHILRTSFTYRNLTSVAGTNYNYMLREGSYDEIILKIGYEKNLNKKKLMPYLAGDICLMNIDFEGFNKGDAPGYTTYGLNGKGIGFSPAFGLKYNFSNGLSINAESCVDLVSLKFKHLESTYSNHNTIDIFFTRNFNARFNPLQKLSLNVKF